MIRNGVAYRDVPAREGLAFYADGSVQLYDETATSADQLLADGVWNTLSFGPAVLVDGRRDRPVGAVRAGRRLLGSRPRVLVGGGGRGAPQCAQ